MCASCFGNDTLAATYLGGAVSWLIPTRGRTGIQMSGRFYIERNILYSSIEETFIQQLTVCYIYFSVCLSIGIDRYTFREKEKHILGIAS